MFLFLFLFFTWFQGLDREAFNDKQATPTERLFDVGKINLEGPLNLSQAIGLMGYKVWIIVGNMN